MVTVYYLYVKESLVNLPKWDNFILKIKILQLQWLSNLCTMAIIRDIVLLPTSGNPSLRCLQLLHSHMKAHNQEDPEFSLVLGPTSYVCMYLVWLTLFWHKCMGSHKLCIQSGWYYSGINVISNHSHESNQPDSMFKKVSCVAQL